MIRSSSIVIADSVYRLPWRLLSADLVAFSHLQFSQIRGRQPYLNVRKTLYVILTWGGIRALTFLGKFVTCPDSSGHG